MSAGERSDGTRVPLERAERAERRSIALRLSMSLLALAAAAAAWIVVALLVHDVVA